MAGIIVADTIQSGGDFIRLNSASQTVATINARGIYANTGNLLIAANGTIGVATIANTAIVGAITQAQIGYGVSGTGPAFSAYLSGSNQNVSTGVWTKAQLNTEDYDTNSNFDNSSNFRFTPTIAGYYLITGSISPDSTSSFGNAVFAAIYKNGSLYRAASSYNTSAALASTPTVSTIVYMNGTSDYIELFGQFVGGAGMQYSTNYRATSMSGVLVRT